MFCWKFKSPSFVVSHDWKRKNSFPLTWQRTPGTSYNMMRWLQLWGFNQDIVCLNGTVCVMETIAKQLVKPTLTQQLHPQWEQISKSEWVSEWVALFAQPHVCANCLLGTWGVLEHGRLCILRNISSPVKLLLAPGTPGTHSVTQYKSPLWPGARPRTATRKSH